MTTSFLATFLIILLLISLGVGLFIFSAWTMILFSTVKIILALYYSLIKRAILLCKMRRKFKKATAQNLGNYQAEGRGQNTVPATQFSVLSFKESLELSRKDYKIISCITFIAVALFACAAFFLSLITQYTTVPRSDILPFFYIGALPLLFILLLSVFSLPVILILHSLLTFGVKKTVKKLETFA